MDNFFEIKYCDSGVIITKDGASFRVEKGPDGDIWFNSSNCNIELAISFYSRNQDEWRCFIVFEYLMKSLIGRYILNGDDKDGYSSLPKDFINLDNKTITWHSDSEYDNMLQLQLKEKELIISIIIDNNSNNRNYSNSTKVRIRTSGSSYEYYYKEFERFYDELSSFAYSIELSKNQDASANDKNSTTKKLSLFRKLKK